MDGHRVLDVGFFVALLNRFRIFSCLSLFVSLPFPPGSLLGVMILRDVCVFGRRGTGVCCWMGWVMVGCACLRASALIVRLLIHERNLYGELLINFVQ
jgi:hypothetical protein